MSIMCDWLHKYGSYGKNEDKLLEEILVKDAVHAGLLEQQRTIHQKYLFLRLLVTVFCTEQQILEVHFTSLPVASLTFLQTR